MTCAVDVVERNYCLNSLIAESIIISSKLIVSIISANCVLDVDMRNC